MIMFYRIKYYDILSPIVVFIVLAISLENQANIWQPKNLFSLIVALRKQNIEK